MRGNFRFILSAHRKYVPFLLLSYLVAQPTAFVLHAGIA
jgi:hypothetical protein